MIQFLTDNFSTILLALFGSGSFTMFFFERRKNKAIAKGAEAEAESKEIDNGNKVIDLYKKALDDLPNRYEFKYNEMAKLWEKKATMLKDEIAQLENSFKRKIKLLEDEIKLKNSFIRSLKKELKDRDAEIIKLTKQVADAKNKSS